MGKPVDSVSSIVIKNVYCAQIEENICQMDEEKWSFILLPQTKYLPGLDTTLVYKALRHFPFIF